MRSLSCVAALAALAGCGSPNSDFAKGPVILQCDGDMTSSIMGQTSTRKTRHHFKIDAKQKTLKVFNDKEFVAWGDGTPEIGPDLVTFVSKDLTTDGSFYAVRDIKIDRSSGQITDRLTLGVGGGSIFEGDCKPVSEPEQVANKF